VGTASLFDNILKHGLSIHAAWLPITNTFEIGDYGIISDGVLAKMGNLRAMGVGWTAKGGLAAQLNFASDDTRIVRAVGNATVQAFPDQDIDASLTIEFERESSFLVKARLTVTQMEEVAAVAEKLSQLPHWKTRYRVVSAVHVGQQCTILSSTGAKSKIALSGKANALRQLDFGSVSAGVEVSSSERIGLEIVGQTGVVGLSLFKLRWLIGGVEVLGAPPLTDPNARLSVETSMDWESLEDDV
jgi:hypothetical protein